METAVGLAAVLESKVRWADVAYRDRLIHPGTSISQPNNRACFHGGRFVTPYILGQGLVSDRIRTVTLGSNFTVRIFSKSSGNLGGEVAKTLPKHLFY